MANCESRPFRTGPTIAVTRFVPVNILVTGATGFIGSAYCKLAANRGHSLAAIVRPQSGRPIDFPGAVSVLRGTLAEPPWELIEQFHPEVCVHAAWITTPGVYLESPDNELYRAWSLEFL